MSQTPQMFTWTGDKPQQTDCLALVSSESKNIQLTILQKSMPHIYSCSTLPCFHLLPPSLGMFAQGKEVQRQKSVVNVSIWQEWVLLKWGNLNCRWREIRCCPKFLLTSLYECGSRFRGEEKSAAISLIPPRGPRPQTVDGNVRSIQPTEGGREDFQPSSQSCLPAIR